MRLLNIEYVFKLFGYNLNEAYNDLTDISRRELVTIIPLAALVIFFGVYPAPLLNMIAPAMDGIIKIVQSVL